LCFFFSLYTAAISAASAYDSVLPLRRVLLLLLLIAVATMLLLLLVIAQ
jgi:hypothetical protein